MLRILNFRDYLEENVSWLQGLPKIGSQHQGPFKCPAVNIPMFGKLVYRNLQCMEARGAHIWVGGLLCRNLEHYSFRSFIVFGMGGHTTILRHKKTCLTRLHAVSKIPLVNMSAISSNSMVGTFVVWHCDLY